VDLRLRRGAFDLEVAFACGEAATALFGPSGAGKSTVLAAVAGLLRPEAGEIRLGEEILFDAGRGICVPPERRRVGMVFQDALLFPHMGVRGNLLYGRRRAGPDAPGLERVVGLLDLEPLLDRRPATLSGGEKQRVALGRALLSGPRLLLLDEPLSALDQALKNRVLPYLRRVRDELSVPILYVSHSLSEVLEITEDLVVLEGGRVRARGHLLEVLRSPEVLSLVEAAGFENVLPVRVAAHEPERGLTRMVLGEQELKTPLCAHQPGARALVGIRAHDIILARSAPEGISARNGLAGRVTETVRVDGRILIEVDVGERLLVEITPDALEELRFRAGEKVVCLVKTHSVRVGPVLR
jgi:molybdate transport system ATP-binding protein